jgi:hypothetical protein
VIASVANSHRSKNASSRSPIEHIVEAYETAREPKGLTLLDRYVLDVYSPGGVRVSTKCMLGNPPRQEVLLRLEWKPRP